MHFSQIIKKPLLLISVALLVKAAIVTRKKTKAGDAFKLLDYDANSIYLGVKKAYLSPRNWKGNDLYILATVAAGIGFLYIYDEEISTWFRKKGKTALPLLKDFGWYYGSPENHYLINAGFYLYGFIFRNEEIRKTGVLLISASLAAGILQTILKVMIGRARPLRNEGKFSFNPLSRDNSFFSFPSGHSILSFTTAYAVATQFEQPSLKLSMYAFGAIAPFTRLWAGAHWITDAATSFCISIPLVNSIDNFLRDERYYNSGQD